MVRNNLARLAVLVITLPVKEPVGDLELAGVLHNGEERVDVVLSELASTDNTTTGHSDTDRRGRRAIGSRKYTRSYDEVPAFKMRRRTGPMLHAKTGSGSAGSVSGTYRFVPLISAFFRQTSE